MRTRSRGVGDAGNVQGTRAHGIGEWRNERSGKQRDVEGSRERMRGRGKGKEEKQKE